jgi:hypothetical protein
MGAGELRAAGSLRGLEFHEFNAGLVCVVDVKLPFAIASDFRFFAGFDSGFHDLGFESVDVRNAERDVIHNAEGAFVSVRCDVEHILDPLVALGDLHSHPVVFVVRHAAVPVGAEAEFIDVEAVCGLAIVHDEAGMDDANRVRGIRGR